MRMRKIMMGLALLATISAGAQELTSGIDRNNMNLKVKPGNDFYEYAAGGWMKSHPLDAEHADNGAFTDLFELSQEQVRGLILGYADGKQPQGSLGQKIGSLYRLAMDSVRRNREGVAPVKPILDQMEAARTVADLQKVQGKYGVFGYGVPMGMGFGADEKNAKMNIFNIYQGGLTLGQREYYLDNDQTTADIRNAYKQFIVDMFKLFGFTEQQAQQKRDLIIALITLKYTQSNSVCYTYNGQTIGVGAGQQSRIHCTRLAGQKADNWQLRHMDKVLNLPFRDDIAKPNRDNAIDVYIGDTPEDVIGDDVWAETFTEQPVPLTAEEKKEYLSHVTGVCLGSDAFFPFGDNIERARRSGVTAIVQPGGSIRDQQVIDTCNKYGIAMAFCGIRLFHH